MFFASLIGVLLLGLVLMALSTLPQRASEPASLNSQGSLDRGDVLILTGTLRTVISSTQVTVETLDFVAWKDKKRDAARVDLFDSDNTLRSSKGAKGGTYWQHSGDPSNELTVLTSSTSAVHEYDVGGEFFGWIDSAGQPGVDPLIESAPLESFEGVQMTKVISVSEIATDGSPQAIWIDPEHLFTRRQLTWNEDLQDFMILDFDYSETVFVSPTLTAGVFAVPDAATRSRPKGMQRTIWNEDRLAEFTEFPIYTIDGQGTLHRYKYIHFVGDLIYETETGLTDTMKSFFVTGPDYELIQYSLTGHIPVNEIARLGGDTEIIEVNGYRAELDESAGGARLDVWLEETWITVLAKSRQEAEDLVSRLERVN